MYFIVTVLALHLKVHSENCVVLLLLAWTAANPSASEAHVRGRVLTAQDSGSEEEADADSDADDDYSDGGEDDEEGQSAASAAAAAAAATAAATAAAAAAAAAVAGPPRDIDERQLSPYELIIRTDQPVPGPADYYSQHLAHYVRVSHLSPSYLHSIVPNTPWFTVRVQVARGTGFCCYLNFSPLPGLHGLLKGFLRVSAALLQCLSFTHRPSYTHISPSLAH